MSDEREFKYLRDQQNLQNAQGRSEIESTMSSDPKKQWEEKLVGKKITEGSGSAVCLLYSTLSGSLNDH